MRLWPWSRHQFPKHFLSLVGTQSLFSQTILRAARLPGTAEVTVVLGEAQVLAAERELDGLDVSVPVRLLVEPAARNTAPAILLAALDVGQRHGNASLAVMPADHLIRNEAEFVRCAAVALQEAESGQVAVVGIQPTYPEPGFGYIRAATRQQVPSPIRAFVEKPGKQRAQELMDEGAYWNAGLFFLHQETACQLLKRHQLDLYKCVSDYVKSRDPEAFVACPSTSFDCAVMEVTKQAVVVPASFGWSDVGSWSGLRDVSNPDEAGNVLRGDAKIIDCQNTLAFSQDRLVVGLGLKDIIIAETQDAVLVAHHECAQEVREVVRLLESEGRAEVSGRATELRPWGSFTVLAESPVFKIKRLDVLPGARLSLQRHQFRREYWVVVAGRARVIVGEEVRELDTHQTTIVPCGAKHRIENPGEQPLTVVEVQVGSYFGEDDIERFDDDFGRL